MLAGVSETLVKGLKMKVCTYYYGFSPIQEEWLIGRYEDDLRKEGVSQIQKLRAMDMDQAMRIFLELKKSKMIYLRRMT